MIDAHSVTPLEIISAAITTVCAPTIAWLTRNGRKLVRRYDQLSIQMRDARRDIDALQAGAQSSDTRLTRVEDAIVEIRVAVQRSDEQYTAIMAELKLLPRLAVMVEGLTITASGIVPRAEVDARLQSAEERIRLVEQDIRSGRSA